MQIFIKYSLLCLHIFLFFIKATKWVEQAVVGRRFSRSRNKMVLILTLFLMLFISTGCLGFYVDMFNKLKKVVYLILFVAGNHKSKSLNFQTSKVLIPISKNNPEDILIFYTGALKTASCKCWIPQGVGVGSCVQQWILKWYVSFSFLLVSGHLLISVAYQLCKF